MICPKCQEPYVCPCKACTERRGTQSKWTRTENVESCGGCGFAQNLFEWLEEEYRQYQEIKKNKP
jgi:hypothetical protein